MVCVRLKMTGKLYAMKIMSKQHILQEAAADTRSETLSRLHAERNVCMGAKHCFITRAVASLQSEDYAMIVMEMVDGMKMSTLLRHTGGLALALRYLHDNNVLYRDIKVDNVLIDEDGHIKLVDMGLVAKINCCHAGVGSSSLCEAWCEVEPMTPSPFSPNSAVSSASDATTKSTVGLSHSQHTRFLSSQPSSATYGGGGSALKNSSAPYRQHPMRPRKAMRGCCRRRIGVVGVTSLRRRSG